GVGFGPAQNRQQLIDMMRCIMYGESAFDAKAGKGKYLGLYQIDKNQWCGGLNWSCDDAWSKFVLQSSQALRIQIWNNNPKCLQGSVLRCEQKLTQCPCYNIVCAVKILSTTVGTF